MDKYSRLGKNTILVFLGNAGVKLIGLLMLPFYTRWLSVDDYGLTDVLSVYVTLLIGFVSCCIGESLFIFPKNATDDKKKVYFSTGMSFIFVMLCVTAIIFTLCSVLGEKYNIQNSFFDNIWYIFIMIVCTLLQQVTQQFTRSIDRMKVYSITGIVVTICTALFSFFIIPQYGVYGYVVSHSFACLMGAIYSFVASGSFRYFQLNVFSRSKCYEMLKYSIPLIPNSIMWWLVGALNRPIMEANIGLGGIGLYAVANKFPGLLTMMFSMFATSLQISVMEEYGKDGFSCFYNKVYRIVSLFLFTVLFVLIMCSRWIVILFTTPEYYDAWRYVSVLALGAVLSSMSSMSGIVYSAVKQSKYYFYSSIYGAITSIVSNIILIPMLGILGATLSVVFSFMIMSISRIYFAWRYVKLQQLYKYIEMILFSVVSIISALQCKNVVSFLSVNLILLILIFWLNRDLIVEIKKIICKSLKKL